MHLYIYGKDLAFKISQLFSKNTNIYVMPQSRSIDIDNHFDLNLIKHIKEIKMLNFKNKLAFVLGGSGLIGNMVINKLEKLGAKP